MKPQKGIVLMTQTYRLEMLNNSDNSYDFCVYQRSADTTLEPVDSVAWSVYSLAPTVKGSLMWSPDLEFVWGPAGVVAPGVIFEASQRWPGSPTGQNVVTLQKNAGGALTFADLGAGGKQGAMTIETRQDVPPQDIAIGLNMTITTEHSHTAASAALIAQAHPGQRAVFAPPGSYWLTFGSFKTGEILSNTKMAHSVQLVFPTNVYELSATLNRDETWTVKALG